MISPLLEVKNISKSFYIKKSFAETKELKALSSINLTLNKNETLGIVGESGCGKSTLAKVLTLLELPTDGSIEFDQQDHQKISKNEFHSFIQMVFQDPYQSLNPRKKAFDIIADPLRINTKLSEKEIAIEVHAMMEKVGLRAEFANRYPHHFSGGQRQRLGIARALMLRPKVLILDEPVSALDVSIQAQVLNLLLELQKEFSLSYIFISHDLSVVEHICDKIAVMYLGRIVEYGPRDDIFNHPRHPYTKVLLESAPKITTNSTQENSFEFNFQEAPSALYLPKGCAFAPRCSYATSECQEQRPELSLVDKRLAACFNANIV